MKVTDFNKSYEQAKKVDVFSDIDFNCAGWFWVNLTEKQHIKMYNLLLEQGNIEKNNSIELKNGIALNRLNNTTTICHNCSSNDT